MCHSSVKSGLKAKVEENIINNLHVNVHTSKIEHESYRETLTYFMHTFLCIVSFYGHRAIFCVLWKTDSHVRLEQHESERTMTEFSFVELEQKFHFICSRAAKVGQTCRDGALETDTDRVAFSDLWSLFSLPAAG